MIEITEQEFEDRKDYYCDKAESGTVVLVEKPDGAKILVVPQNPNDLSYDYLRDHDDACEDRSYSRALSISLCPER